MFNNISQRPTLLPTKNSHSGLRQSIINSKYFPDSDWLKAHI